jgi:SRSO17 transposase
VAARPFSGAVLALEDDTAAWSRVDPAAWAKGFNELFALIAGEFAQVQSRHRARGYLLGLLSQAERKNGWSIAEFAGDCSPAGMQRLLNLYAWDADAVRDVLRGYVVSAVGHPAGVLVADETGFLKKGSKSAGVQRQYTGTAGRIENCQVGVFLAYATAGGARALIDRELYVPASWCADRDRCREAGIGDEVVFATKPELARAMVERAAAAGVPFSWFTADEVYGENPHLRSWLQGEGISYVMAVPCSQEFPAMAGKMRADALAAVVPSQGWQTLSCADGAKGPRLYDWALIATTSAHHWLLVRRSLTANSKGKRELAFFTCHAPRGATLAELIAVAGARWAVEECFQAAKNETGLDHYQVRLYPAWYRHITLSMLAHAFLAVTAAACKTAAPGPAQPPAGSEGDRGEAGKRGTRHLWTTIPAGQDWSPARAHP